MSAQVPDQHRTAVKRTREKLSNARHLPGDFYTSTDIEALERTHIFGREWLCVGRQEEFPDPGDFRTLDIAGEPIIICRSKSGTMRGFYNVCRHRGTQIEEDMSMITALQKGFASKGFEPGPMSWFEKGVHHVIQYNLDRIYGRSN